MELIHFDFNKKCYVSSPNDGGVYSDEDLFRGDLNELIIHRFERLIKTIAYNLHDHNFYYNPVDKITLGKRVIKSKTNRKVYLCDYRARDNKGESINLPRSFEFSEFNSIIACTKGPYTKKNVNGKLIDCETWSAKEVFFVGKTIYECVEHYIYNLILEFLNNEVTKSVITSVKENCHQIPMNEEVARIISLDPTSIKLSIETIYRKQIEDCEESDMYSPDNSNHMDGYQSEIDIMDEETDGHWRWNID